MVYHVIHRPSSNQLKKSKARSDHTEILGPISVTKLMPRYHYSRATPDSNENHNESIVTGRNGDESTIKIQTTLPSVNDENVFGPLKAAFVPLTSHSRSTTPKRREFISIPITRDDGNSNITTNNSTRTVPITYVQDATNPLTTTPTPTNANSIHLLRPSSRYFQYHMNQRHGADGVTTVTVPTLPRLSSGSRRLSLTLPVTVNKTVSNNNSTTTEDGETKKNNVTATTTTTASTSRQIPIRFPQPAPVVSIPSPGSRISSALYHAAPTTTSLQRQSTIDSGDDSTSIVSINAMGNSDFTTSSPTRQTEIIKESVQTPIRVQHQMRHRNYPTNSHHRSPSQSRRVIINLQNSQCLPLDVRLSSAMKPPVAPSTSSRSAQRNNLYYIPVLHEIQMPTELATEYKNANNFKNEYHIEIPVTISRSNDQENRDDIKYDTDDGTNIRDPNSTSNGNSNQTLKSILKRSSSRDTVARKNVSFMNA